METVEGASAWRPWRCSEGARSSDEEDRGSSVKAVEGASAWRLSEGARSSGEEDSSFPVKGVGASACEGARTSGKEDSSFPVEAPRYLYPLRALPVCVSSDLDRIGTTSRRRLSPANP